MLEGQGPRKKYQVCFLQVFCFVRRVIIIAIDVCSEMSEREGLSEARGGGGGSWTFDLKTPPSPRTFTQSKGKQEGRNDA